MADRTIPVIEKKEAGGALDGLAVIQSLEVFVEDLERLSLDEIHRKRY